MIRAKTIRYYCLSLCARGNCCRYFGESGTSETAWRSRRDLNPKESLENFRIFWREMCPKVAVTLQLPLVGQRHREFESIPLRHSVLDVGYSLRTLPEIRAYLSRPVRHDYLI